MATADEMLKQLSQVEDENLKGATGGLRQEGLTWDERLVLKNLFDTQPARRKAYLKSINLQEDPQDQNKLRPLGSPPDAPYNIPVEAPNGGFKEFVQDVGDIGGDVLKGSAVTGGGAVGGTAGGAAGIAAAIGSSGAAIPAVPALVTLGTITGGALGAAAAEEIKKHLGDIFLGKDKDIPRDKGIMVTDALINGVAGPLLEGGGTLAKGLLGNKLLKAKKAVGDAIKASGNSIDENIIQRVAQNIDEYTPEKVKDAVAKSHNLVKKLFGIDPEDINARTSQIKDLKGIPRGSIFYEQSKPIEDAKDIALKALSNDSDASVSGADVAKRYDEFLNAVAIKKQLGQPLEEVEKDALPVVMNLYKEVKENAAAKLGTKVKDLTKEDLANVRFDFGEADTFLKNLQNQSFVQKPGQLVASENRLLANMAHDSRVDLDSIPKALGPNHPGFEYPELKQATKSITDTYNLAKKDFTPQKIYAAYKGGSPDAEYDLRRLIEEGIDKPLGLTGTPDALSPQFEKNTAERWMDQLYQKGAKIPRSEQEQMIQAGKNAGLVSGGLKGGGIGGTIGTAVGGLLGNPIGGAAIGTSLGTAAGGLRGMVKGGAEAALQADLPAAMRQYAAIQAELAKPQVQGLSERAISAVTNPIAGGQFSTRASEAVSPFISNLLPKSKADELLNQLNNIED